MRTRWKITIEYDGQPFVGWQRQKNGITVQETIENAIHAFSQESVTLFGAGRTDSGVHALGQSAHFDLSCETSPDIVRDAINFHLRPLPIVTHGLMPKHDITNIEYSTVVLPRLLILAEFGISLTNSILKK